MAELSPDHASNPPAHKDVTSQSPPEEHRGLVPGAAGMLVAGILTTFLAPLLAVSFAKDFNFGIESAGLLVAAGQAGVALGAFGVTPFIGELNRKALALVGVGVAAAGLAATGFASEYYVVLGLQVMVGVGAGLSYAAANSALAYARLPERAFSLVTISYMIVGAAMLTLSQSFRDLWPTTGLYLAMAAAELLCMIAIIRVPDVRRLSEPSLAIAEAVAADPQATPRSNTARADSAVALVIALLLINIGNLAIWTYAQDIGDDLAMSPQTVSTFLGLSQLVGLLGAGVTLILGAKVGKLVLLVPGVTILAVGNLLAGIAGGSWVFMVGMLMINISYFCVMPLLLALAAELDSSSGRLVVMASGMTLVAGAIAPALGGFLAGSANNWSQLGVVCCFLVLAGLPLLLRPVRVAKTEATLAASRTDLARESEWNTRKSAISNEEGPTP